MTEKEWLNCTDPEPMLDFVEGKASDRKFQLFAVAWPTTSKTQVSGIRRDVGQWICSRGGRRR